MCFSQSVEPHSPAPRERAAGIETRDAILRPVAFLLAWIFLLVGALDGAEAAENVLLGRPATLSTPPNYPSAQAGAETVLTDGREASGLYWRNGTSLGWEWRSTVVVSIELKAPAPVDRVRIQAGAKLSGGILFPVPAASLRRRSVGSHSLPRRERGGQG